MVYRTEPQQRRVVSTILYPLEEHVEYPRRTAVQYKCHAADKVGQVKVAGNVFPIVYDS